MSYFVKSWTLPKRKVGYHPAGYVSTIVNDRIDALSRAREWSRGKLGRRVEIKDAWTGEATYYTILPDGSVRS